MDGFSQTGKTLGILSGISLIVFGFFFNHTVVVLHGGPEWFSYLGILLIIVGCINLFVVLISYFRRNLKIDTLIGIRLVLLFIGRLTYFFSGAQINYNFFLTCLYLDFGIATCIVTLFNEGFKLSYKKKYTNTIILFIALLQTYLLFGSIKDIGSYASARTIPALTIWLGLNICLLSAISLRSKSTI